MKTQTFGLSDTIDLSDSWSRSFAPLEASVAAGKEFRGGKVALKTLKVLEILSLIPVSRQIVYNSYAHKDYRAKRENGDNRDAPSYAFPKDGEYFWESPKEGFSQVRYTEGPKDKIWMKERDRNYIFRLEQEGQLDAIEPNLETEVPDLYAELMEKRKQKRASADVMRRSPESEPEPESDESFEEPTHILSREELKESIAEDDEALRLDPKDASTYRDRGYKKIRLGQYKDAIDDLDEALRLCPGDEVAYHYRGCAKCALRQYESAIADFDKSLKGDVKNKRIEHDHLYQRKLISDYGQTFTYKNAISDLNETLQVISEESDLDEAQQLLKKIITYLSQGEIKFKFEYYENAITDFNQALQLASSNPSVPPAFYSFIYYACGSTKIILEQYENAIANFNKALQLDPENAMAYCLRGYANYKLEQHENAIADCNEVLLRDDKNALAYRYRGTANIRLGKHKEAIADFSKALQFDPKSVAAYRFRGEEYYKLGEYEKAKTDCNQALDLQPRYRAVHLNRGRVKVELEDDDGAITDFDNGILLNPSYLEDLDLDSRLVACGLYLNRGTIKLRRGLYKDAIADFNEAQRFYDEYFVAVLSEVFEEFTKDANLEFDVYACKRVDAVKWQLIEKLVDKIPLDQLQSKQLRDASLEEKNEFRLFLKLAIFHNTAWNEIFDVIREQHPDDLLETILSYCYSNNLCLWLCHEIIAHHPSVVTQILDYEETNIRYLQGIRIQLEHIVSMAVREWQKVLLNERLLSAPVSSTIPDLSSTILTSTSHAMHVVSHSSISDSAAAAATTVAKDNEIHSFPIESLLVLLQFSQEIQLETLLDIDLGTHHDTSPTLTEECKRWLVKRFFMKETDPGYETFVQNIKWVTVSRLLKSMYNRLQIFNTIRSGDIFNWEKITNIHVFREAAYSLQKYFSQFYTSSSEDSALNFQLLVLAIAQDANFITWLNSIETLEQEKFKHLIAVTSALQIPGLDGQAVLQVINSFKKLHKMIQESSIPSSSTHTASSSYITDFNGLFAALANQEHFQKALELLQNVLDLVMQLEPFALPFIQSVLVPMDSLLAPLLQDLFKILLEKRQIEAEEMIDLGACIDTSILLEQKLGDALYTPVGNVLRERQIVDCQFVRSEPDDAELQDTKPQEIRVAGISAQFDHLILVNFKFQRCQFRRISFASAKSKNCDFSEALFFETLDISDWAIDIATAHTLFPAIYQSQKRYGLTIIGKLNLSGHDHSSKLFEIDQTLRKHVNIDQASGVIFCENLHAKSVRHDQYVSLSAPEESISMHTEEAEDNPVLTQQSWFGNLSYAGSFIAETSSIAHTTVQSLMSYLNYPQEALKEMMSNAQYDTEQQAKVETRLNETLEKLREQQRKLESDFARERQFQASSTEILSAAQEKLREKYEHNQLALTILQSHVEEYQAYWKAKQELCREQQRLLTHSNSAVSTFYRSLLSELSSSFLIFFLFFNHLKLINPDTGAITNLAKRGGISKVDLENLMEFETDEDLGFLGAVIKKVPLIASIALTSLGKGLDYTLLATKKILKVKEAANLIPEVGGIVSAGLTIVDKANDFVLDQKDAGTIQGVKESTIGIGMTARNLEKLADAIARKVTFAHEESISLLSEEGAIVLGRCGMMRIIVGLLNQQIGHHDCDFMDEVLFTLRYINVSQNNYGGIPNPFNLRFLKHSLSLRDPHSKVKITEEDIYCFTGICLQSSTDHQLKYFLNSRSKTALVGYMRISQEEFERSFKDRFTQQDVKEIDEKRQLSIKNVPDTQIDEGVDRQAKSILKSAVIDDKELRKVQEKNRLLREQLSTLTRELHSNESGLHAIESLFQSALSAVPGRSYPASTLDMQEQFIKALLRETGKLFQSQSRGAAPVRPQFRGAVPTQHQSRGTSSGRVRPPSSPRRTTHPSLSTSSTHDQPPGINVTKIFAESQSNAEIDQTAHRSQREINQVMVDGTMHSSITVEVKAEGHCGFTVTEYALRINGMDKLAVATTRKGFINTVKEIIVELRSTLKTTARSQKLTELVQAIYEDARIAFDFTQDKLTQWEKLFEKSELWASDVHFTLMSYMHNIRFEFYIVDHEKNDRLIPRDGSTIDKHDEKRETPVVIKLLCNSAGKINEAAADPNNHFDLLFFNADEALKKQIRELGYTITQESRSETLSLVAP